MTSADKIQQLPYCPVKSLNQGNQNTKLGTKSFKSFSVPGTLSAYNLSYFESELTQCLMNG